MNGFTNIKKRRLLSFVGWQSLMVLAVGPAGAQPVPGQTPVPVPQINLVPVTTNSFPLGAADHLNVPEDLSKVGYVEEE